MTHFIKPKRTGFTLIELLVVIGIIVVLLGILLPVVAHVRKAAFQTNSQVAITNIANACEAYRTDHGAYPGIFPNSWFIGTATTCTFTPTAPATLPTGITASLTMTENMILSLLGGLEITAVSPGVASFSGAQVGVGPMSHNPIVSARRRFPPYIDAVPGVTLQDQTLPLVAATPWNRTVITMQVDGWTSKDMPTIPELVDRFPDPLPIIYLRANVGVGEIAGTDNASHWNAATMFPYIRDNVKAGAGIPYFPGSTEDLNNDGDVDSGEDLNGVLPTLAGPSEKDYGSVTIYFTNPAVPGQPRQKDGFFLIGPGPDRKYGTRDDQTNTGGL